MKIAFIPVRIGSKSIPKKNIKDLNGKPLIYWSCKALQESKGIDKIIVASDSEEIDNVVRLFNFSKIELYRRMSENALDTSSTESVMLEYINYNNKLNKDDIFILVQVTNPFLKSEYIDEAINIFNKKDFKSIVSVSISKKFEWFYNSLDNSFISDYYIKGQGFIRKRRQDLQNKYFENGSFYISKVKDILENKNRLSCPVGIYCMPEYTGIDIDDEADWVMCEALLEFYK